MRRRGDWGNARRVHTVAENSTDDEKTVEKLTGKESGCGQDEKTTVTKLAEERTGAPCDRK
jgi:hypothetical protein